MVLVRSIYFTLDRDSGRAYSEKVKQPRYPGMTRLAELLVNFDDQSAERVALEYHHHGSWRDVYVGVSQKLGRIVLKCQPETIRSNANEMSMLAKGFAEFAVPVHASGQCPTRGTGYVHLQLDCLLQARVQCLDDELREYVQKQPPSASAIRVLVEEIYG